MALKPEQKDRLTKFTAAAKAIIYNADRFRQLLKLMDTKGGAIQAVKSVMGGIEQKQPIPPDLSIFLAVNIYMLMVDMAQEATGMKADKTIVQGVVAALMQSTLDAQGSAQAPGPAAPTPPAQPPGPPAAQPAAPAGGMIAQGA